MKTRFYKDYFTVPEKYTANMTREELDNNPDQWLDFYPHAKYLEFLNTLFDESKSVWLTGNYGTGKSYAALVTHRLFMDEQIRVEKWFNKYAKEIPNSNTLKKKLLEERKKGILVIYDYNASGIGPNEEFIVRLEKGIIAALKSRKYSVPAEANLDLVIERLKREGNNFFNTRDSMLDEMKSLKKDIKTIDQLITKLKEETISKTPTHFLEDVQTVLHKDSIYLNIDVPTFRKWISEICKENNLKRIIYIFDEFSDFIEYNSSTLKTFEEVTEAPAVNHFYLVPVTHKELNAFYGENSPGANKAKDRFYFRNLQMPNDVAFRLAYHAMQEVESQEIAEEWKEEKNKLWSSIKGVVDQFTDPETSEAYVSRESFYNILPIQPMTAFLLKFLSESARSNQRSIFEYLKGSADGREFQDFIATGGPSISNRQFLTVDYLWKYFMEREDSGQSKEINSIKMEYDRIVNREYINYSDEAPEIRVLKAVMLFALLSRLNPAGHDRLRATVDNIELSFRGDGTVLNVDSILRDMAINRHCFSIINGNIDLYSTTVGNDEIEKKKKELSDQFYELLTPTCKNVLEKQTGSARSGFSSMRFDIRVTDVSHTTASNMIAATRDRFSVNLNKDDGSICLWFVVAKTKADQLLIQSKQAKLLEQLRGHRIIMFAFPEITFCEKNVNLWDEYVEIIAQYQLENNTTAKEQIEKSYKKIEEEWTNNLKASGVRIDYQYYDTLKQSMVSGKISWANLKSFLRNYTKNTLNGCPDTLTDQITAFSNKALKAWALAGLKFSGIQQQGQLINSLKSQGVDVGGDWFKNNPNHIFSLIHTLLKKKYDNTVGKGTTFSVRKAYIELQRAPFGLRYNCLSAFSLGFCLRWLLSTNAQWTNGQMQKELDDTTLAEIIEATVSEKTDKEKMICRHSKEAKCFAQKAGLLFGLPQSETMDPTETLRQIANKVENTSCKVPLWIMADYIRNLSPENENAAAILDKICIALRISSKGKTEDRSSAINDIGAELNNTPEIINIVATHTKQDEYITAFRQYVDYAAPEIIGLAEKVEDLSHAYCDMILEKAAPVAGWLWNKSDITSVIEEAIFSYKFMEKARSFLSLSGFTQFDDIVERILVKLDSLGLPYSIVSDKYPGISVLINELTGKKEPKKLYQFLDGCIINLKELYNDSSKKLAINLVRELIGDTKVSDEDLRDILGTIQKRAEYDVDMSSHEYIELIKNEISNNIRNTIIMNIEKEWKRITGYKTIADWTNTTNLPAWTAFYDNADDKDLLSALTTPENLTDKTLESKLEILRSLPKIKITDCQDSFLNEVVPPKFKKFNIELGALLTYLSSCSCFGNDPNKWPKHPDISDFIKEQYQKVFAPSVLSLLREEDAEVLKEKILALAKVNPDVGIMFMEL